MGKDTKNSLQTLSSLFYNIICLQVVNADVCVCVHARARDNQISVGLLNLEITSSLLLSNV